MVFKGISLSVFSILDLPHLTTIHFHQRSFYKTYSLVLDHLPIFNHVVFEECSFHNIQQMILSSIGFDSAEFKTEQDINLIRLENKKYGLLIEEDYLQYASLLKEFCDAE